MQKLFLGNLDITNDPIKYINAVTNGILSKHSIDYLHSKNIAFDPKTQQLSIDQNSKYLMFKRRLKVFLFGTERVEQIKKILRYCSLI